MSLNEFSIAISNSVYPRKPSHYHRPTPTPSFFFLLCSLYLMDHPRAAHRSPFHPPDPQRSPNLLTLPPKCLTCQSSSQSLPTVAALVQVNLSVGWADSLLTGLIVSQFLQTVCLTTAEVTALYIWSYHLPCCKFSMDFPFLEDKCQRPVLPCVTMYDPGHHPLFPWLHHFLNDFTSLNTVGNFTSPRTLSGVLWSPVSGRPVVTLVSCLFSSKSFLHLTTGLSDLCHPSATRHPARPSSPAVACSWWHLVRR